MVKALPGLIAHAPVSAAQTGASSAADVTAAANLPRCIWFVWQGFGSDGGATAVAPVRSC